MHIQDLETPSVLIDLDIMERNIQRMQARCNALGIDFRPHIKTHKIPDIARRQLEAGAVGIACQKVTEAQVFAEAGIDDIQIPYIVIGAAKARRLAELARRVRVTAAADSLPGVEGLAAAARQAGVVLRVLVDLATSIQRTGAPPALAIDLARCIDSEPSLHFGGMLVYPSTVDSRPALLEVLQQLDRDGIAVEAVSGGGSGAALEAADFPELTELRVGTYVFYDWSSVGKGWAQQSDCAMTVAATVISRPDDDRATLDSGSKALAADRWADGHGHIVEYPDAHIHTLSEEHAHVDLSRCQHKPAVGERVHVIPVHTCVVTNLHNQIYGVRNGQVEVEWPVAARGLLW
ncbi:MAG: alanine racemase [Phototrophicaceae bacterium]